MENTENKEYETVRQETTGEESPASGEFPAGAEAPQPEKTVSFVPREVTDEPMTGAPADPQRAADDPTESAGDQNPDVAPGENAAPAEDEGTAAPAENPAEPQYPAWDAGEDLPEPTGEPADAAELWNYADQLAADRKAGKKAAGRGSLIYALVMTGMFCICLGILAAVLLTGFNGRNHPNTPDTPSYPEQTQNPQEFTPSDPYGVTDVFEYASPSVVGVTVSIRDSLGQVGTGTGTGVVYSSDGYIITNYHVVENSTAITVILNNKARVPAALIGTAPESDLAVIKIEGQELVPAKFGNSDALRVGERVVAIGCPSGLEFFDTLTVGYVSAVNRNVRIYDENDYLQKTLVMIQTDTPLNPGNSGGPLINMNGEVIGINTLKLNETESLGFAIPINGALTAVRSIITTGTYTGDAVAHTGVSLGIQCLAVKKGETVNGVTPTLTAGETGIFVVEVVEGRSSYGKLKAGDIIMKVDGVAVDDVDAMRELLFDHRVGEMILLTVYRDGAAFDITILLK